jgi:hypothetical protein
MADYSADIQNLNVAAEICKTHEITTQVNGVVTTYPRWPTAWAACEVVWRNYLDMKTMEGSGDEDDRRTVMIEAARLRGL